jgi:hypothetical protein
MDKQVKQVGAVQLAVETQAFLQKIHEIIADDPKWTYDRIIELVLSRQTSLDRGKERRELNKTAMAFYKERLKSGEAQAKASGLIPKQ